MRRLVRSTWPAFVQSGAPGTKFELDFMFQVINATGVRQCLDRSPSDALPAVLRNQRVIKTWVALVVGRRPARL